MTKPERLARAGRSICLGTSRLQSYAPRGLCLALFVTAIGCFPFGAPYAQTVSPETICLPPQEPFVPTSDDDLKVYADMVSDDFERYFAQLTAYFSCMDDTRQAVFDRARLVSQDHQTFWQRANALGMAEKAARPLRLQTH